MNYYFLFYCMKSSTISLNEHMNQGRVQKYLPDSKVHGANMGPTWVPSAPVGPHGGRMNLAIRAILDLLGSENIHLHINNLLN